ncbi:hypothetical protein GGX14DRAFT_548714 [Mycena pura]|uniref:Uncharacterized protein n=1 Tax=Mycena pura TaxID=153505 RepID=A0AAD7E429_9AGAR|nr:hypothetical protein GGX14DRAFT_548714 [Mycena pura]
MARPREPLRLNIPPHMVPQQHMPINGQPMFSPSLPTALQGGMYSQLPLRTPMQTFFNPQVPGAPARPTHRQGSASIANFTPSALQPNFPITPGVGHFPRPSLMGQPFTGPPTAGPPFPGRNRRQLSIGGPPKAVLGGPQRKLSPLPPVVDAPVQKTKKVVVKLPKESPKDDDGNLLEKPSWARTPVETPFVYEEAKVAEAELTTAEVYPSDGWRLDIPPTIDVFLPGKRAWQEIKKREIDEKLEKLGVERPTSSHGPHTRAASISSPADPALLLFKLNKLHQAQTTSSLAPSTLNSSSTSPQPPFTGLSPSPRFQPSKFVNRHGHSMSLALPPTFQPHTFQAPPLSAFGIPTSNPFGPDASLPSDQRTSPDGEEAQSSTEVIHAPQGRVPMSMSSLTAPQTLSRPESRDSRPDFTRGFGLDITEEEDEFEEEEGNDARDNFLMDDEANADGEESEEEGDGARTARHSRHVSRLSAALSLRSVGGVVGNKLNGHAHERIDVVPVAPGDTSQDMEVDEEVADWTGSEDQGQYSSEDESLGDFSNPSDEERARQERVERRLHRRRLPDEPRRVPNFPRPPENTLVDPRVLEDDMISNPSEEEALRRAEYQYYSNSPSRRPLPPLPHSRATSGNFTTHDPARAHSRLPSDNITQPQTLNPNAKPFVFGAPVEPFMFGEPTNLRPQTPPKPLVAHTRLPSMGSSLNPAAAEFKPIGFNPAAPEFKPKGFTFKPPPGVPHVAFPEPEHASLPTAESTPYRTQGREKRLRLSEASNDGDTVQSFRFPSNVPSPENMRRDAASLVQASSLNPTADTFRFPHDIVPQLPSLMPLSPGAEETLNEESIGTAKAHADVDATEPELVLPVHRLKRAPIPLDFTHASSPSMQLDFRSNTTVPAGLFKAAANNSGDERTRRTVRSRLSSRDMFDNSRRPSLDDHIVPPISASRNISRSDPRTSTADDLFSSSVRRPSGAHGRKRSSLPDPLRDATNSSVSDEEPVAVDLTSRLEVHRYEERLEALLDEKLDGIRRDIVRSLDKGSLSSSAEAMITEVVQLFRSQLQDSAARSLDNSFLDARGELDLELIKDLVEQGHAEARTILKHELADIAMRMSHRMPLDSAEGLAPLMQELNSRTVDAVVEAIQELSVRLEAVSVAAPARERDSIVDAMMSALAPVLNSLHPEMVDYDYLTDKLTQAVKPHISQLIDLASDKRETAGLIVDRLLPLLPSPVDSKIDTDAITLQLCTEVRRAIAPIDAFEIKEQVADLVVERLDSRLAVRDRALNPETMAGKVTDGVARLLEPMDQMTTHLSSLLDSHKALSTQQADLTSSHKQVLDLISDLPPRLSATIEALNATQTADPKITGIVHHDSETDGNVLRIKSMVEEIAGEQKSLSANGGQLLSLHKEVLEQLNALPDGLAAATNILHGAHAEFALTRDANKREMDELRRNNTEFQVQMAKARGAHGQVRVEKEVLAEKLSIVDADRDRLRQQLKELQASSASKALDVTAVESRNSELEDALAKALARLQASDVTHQTNQDRILELEKVNRELMTEKQALKSKVDSLDLQVTFATRDKDSTAQALTSLQKQHDQLTSQQSHWDELRHASTQIEMLTSLIGQADNEELKELRQIRDRSKMLEGEHAALLKRFKDQEVKLLNGEKAALAARQSLAQAQQRSSEWEKRAKEYEAQLEMTQTKLDQAEQTQSRLDADYSLASLQLEEREAEERLAKERETKLRGQIVALEAKISKQQIELDRSRVKTPPTKFAPAQKSAAAPTPYRNITNGSSKRPDSRASTVYPSRPPSPSASARSNTPPGQQSVSDSIHAPRGPNGLYNSSTASVHAPSLHTPTPASRYSSLGSQRRPPSQAYQPALPAPPSPTPSTVSLAPTQGADGWWS